MSAGSMVSALWCVEICSRYPVEEKKKKRKEKTCACFDSEDFKCDREADSGDVIFDSGLHK